MESIYEANGLRRVVNACGHMTALGVSIISDEVAEAVKQAGQNFVVIDELIDRVREYLKKLPNVSVGMGGGDPTQAPRAARVAALTNPGHVNQTFTGAMYTEGLLTGAKCFDTITNCMMYPTGTVGMVQISTGAVSDSHEKDIVSVETAACMLRDVGVPSVKFFNMHGLKHLEELKALV